MIKIINKLVSVKEPPEMTLRFHSDTSTQQLQLTRKPFIRKKLGFIFLLAMLIAFNGLYGTNTAYAEPIITIDDGGPDDQPGQKDLNQMIVDYSPVGSHDQDVGWSWDETAPGGNLGGNTGDACSLFDTDNDGFANYSLCVVIDGKPSEHIATRLYSCNDSRADRCAGPSSPSTPNKSICSVAVPEGTDPFYPIQSHKDTEGGDQSYNNAAGNAADNARDDTEASCHIYLDEIGNNGSARCV